MAEITVGSRVRVSDKAPQWQERTGMVVEREGAPGNEARRWVVRFDWPLGGTVSQAVFAEEVLELRQGPAANVGSVRLSRDQDPTAQQWEQAVIDASAVLAGDSDARYQVLSRLSRQYLPAALAARTPDADDRVWSSLSSYLRTPATGRKPFALPIEEAEAVVEAIHSIVEQLRKEG